MRVASRSSRRRAELDSWRPAPSGSAFLQDDGGASSSPRDLAHYVIDAATGFQCGFWRCLARGVTLRNTGRPLTRTTSCIAEHRKDVDASKPLADHRLRHGQPGNGRTSQSLLDPVMAQWRQLKERLVFVSPSPRRESRPAVEP